MTEEIGRLGVLVNEFEHPFHPHQGFLRTYKKVNRKAGVLGVFYIRLGHMFNSI